jgi:phosphocarrier protein
MTLAASQGTVLSLETEGEKEAECSAALSALAADYFGEGE